MSDNSLLNAVGLCKKAGKLAIGFDATLEACHKGAPLVIIASDASQRTVRNIEMECTPKNKLLFTGHTREQYAAVLRKQLAVAAVIDVNFARLIEQAAVKQ